MIFTTRRETCPPVTLNGQRIPQAEDAKYLGLHLDRRLNWRKYITIKQEIIRIIITENTVVPATRQQITIVD